MEKDKRDSNCTGAKAKATKGGKNNSSNAHQNRRKPTTRKPVGSGSCGPPIPVREPPNEGFWSSSPQATLGTTCA